MGIHLRTDKPQPSLKPSDSMMAGIDKFMATPTTRQLVPRKRGPKITLPRMTGVESSHLRSCSWKEGLLFVRFRDKEKSVYQYGNKDNLVPQHIFNELQAASKDEESVGRLFDTRVKHSYPCVKL